MRHALQGTALGFLLLAYVTTSSALALASLAPLVMGGGPAVLSSCSGKKPDLTRTSFVQRRHVPLVKHLTLSPIVPSVTSCAAPDVDVLHLQHPEAYAVPTAPLLCSRHGRSPPRA